MSMSIVKCYMLFLINAWLSMEYWRNDTNRAEPENLKKNLSHGHFVHFEAEPLQREASN
jgi:hypothetical protein